jgi:hypothetical protein
MGILEPSWLAAKEKRDAGHTLADDSWFLQILRGFGFALRLCVKYMPGKSSSRKGTKKILRRKRQIRTHSGERLARPTGDLYNPQVNRGALV